MNLSRRNFLFTGAASFMVPSLTSAAEHPAAVSPPLVIGTWRFAKPSCEKAIELLQARRSVLDAVELGINVTEADLSNPSVGLGGIPNAAGIVQLDACIMLGEGHKAGSVAGLEGIKHPISAARRVMEKTKHVMLVGEGARLFALSEGLEAVPRQDSSPIYAEWYKKHQTPSPRSSEKNHDTITVLALDSNRRLAGGCSTSGWARKMPGRVGDSPIIGSGLYVDEEVGAAGATGLGENIMRHCGSFLVVELIRQGLHPQEACLEAIRRIAKKEKPGADLSINFLAIDKQGRYGAAGSAGGFDFCVATADSSRILPAARLTAQAGGPEGGNRK